MSIRATSRLWRRPWAQTIRQRALRSPPRTLAQDPYAFFTKRPRLPAQGGDRTIARFCDAPASRTACPRASKNLAVSENTPLRAYRHLLSSPRRSRREAVNGLEEAIG